MALRAGMDDGSNKIDNLIQRDNRYGVDPYLVYRDVSGVEF
ncbi:MAG TPA: hypothetical protein VFQ43_05285 [Nitrososphaera sp.]|nr:hypothetical protein [Nitrososphaera sp.]